MVLYIIECSDVNNFFFEWYQGFMGGVGYKGGFKVLVQYYLVGV